MFDDAQDIGVVQTGNTGKRGLSFIFTVINDESLADGGGTVTLTGSSDGFCVPADVLTSTLYFDVAVESVRSYKAIWHDNKLQVYPMN